MESVMIVIVIQKYNIHRVENSTEPNARQKKKKNKKKQSMQIKNSHHTLIMYALQKNEQREKNGYNYVLKQ